MWDAGSMSQFNYNLDTWSRGFKGRNWWTLSLLETYLWDFFKKQILIFKIRSRDTKSRSDCYYQLLMEENVILASRPLLSFSAFVFPFDFIIPSYIEELSCTYYLHFPRQLHFLWNSQVYFILLTQCLAVSGRHISVRQDVQCVASCNSFIVHSTSTEMCAIWS